MQFYKATNILYLATSIVSLLKMANAYFHIIFRIFVIHFTWFKKQRAFTP